MINLAISLMALPCLATYSNPHLEKLSLQGSFKAQRTLDRCEKVSKESSLKSIIRAGTKIYYEHIVNSPSFPTLIFFPGGPGGSSIGKYKRFEILKTLFNVILIDPRGFGCNFFGKASYQYKNVGNSAVALDVVEVVKQENLINFFLYGHSYGTVLATVSSYKLEQVGLHPKAVVLEGTVGRWFDHNWNQVYNSIIADNFNVRIRQDPWIVEALNRADQLELDSELFFNEFLRGFYHNNGVLFPYKDSQYSSAQADFLNLSDRDFLEKFQEKIGNSPDRTVGPPQYDESIKNLISCAEVSKVDIEYNIYWNQSLQKIEARPAPGAKDVCADYNLLNPYSPAEFPIRSRLVYLQGTDDPATPVDGAFEHYESQPKKDNKEFILSQGAGHSLFKEALESCEFSVWSAVLKGDLVSSVLNSDGHCK